MLACKAFPAALWRMQSIWKRNKPAWGRNGMAGWNKKYSTETHWLGVSKTGWVRTLGEDNSLLCQNVSSPVRVIVPTTGGASFGASSNLLHAMHVPWTRLALTDGEGALIRRGLDQAAGWEGPIGEVPLGAQFLSAAQLLLWEQPCWTQPVLSTGEANQPCILCEQKNGGLVIALCWKCDTKAWLPAHIKQSLLFLVKDIPLYMQTEKKVQKHSLVEIKIGLFYYCKIWTLDCGLEIRS